VVIVNPPEMVKSKVWVVWEACRKSVTATVKLKVPAEVGMPVIVPESFEKDSPDGSAPAITAQA
jgi:hypothetical protein